MRVESNPDHRNPLSDKKEWNKTHNCLITEFEQLNFLYWLIIKPDECKSILIISSQRGK